MVGRLFTQLGVPPDVLRRYASGGGSTGSGGSGGSGTGSGSGSGSGAPGGAAGKPIAGPGVPGVPGAAGRHLRKESWFRGVADPTGALPAGYT